MDAKSNVLQKGDNKHENFNRSLAILKHLKVKWNLPENLTNYTSNHSHFFLKKDLQESNLIANPIPSL